MNGLVLKQLNLIEAMRILREYNPIFPLKFSIIDVKEAFLFTEGTGIKDHVLCVKTQNEIGILYRGIDTGKMTPDAPPTRKWFWGSYYPAGDYVIDPENLRISGDMNFEIKAIGRVPGVFLDRR